MSAGQDADHLATQAAEAVRRVLGEAEERAAQVVRGAESEAASIRERAEADAVQIRERAEADARAQIEAAKRALDELGGSLAAAVSRTPARSETEPEPTETEEETEPGPHPEPEPERPEPQQEPAESPGAPEAPVSPPSEGTPTVESAPAGGNGDDAAERLVAMKLAVEGKDAPAIEAELIERFGPGDRSELLKDVLERVSR